jgi:small GTP-binding protein
MTSDSESRYAKAIQAVRKTLDRIAKSTPAEREHMREDFDDLQAMADKLASGQVDIVVFGEISTGKSALINALAGKHLAEVDVQGGWTRDVWKMDWDQCSYRLPGFADSAVVLVDTPGLNEVEGAQRAALAERAAQTAELILFVTDSDLNETEFTALTTLAAANKPIILVFNKTDLYSPEERARLTHVLRHDRLGELLKDVPVIATAADPREIEYVTVDERGRESSDWRQPPPDIEELRAAILEMLNREGLALITLNAALFAADKSDRLASLRVKLRDQQANRVIWTYAAVKALAVGLQPVPLIDLASGGAVDAAMLVTLARLYGLDFNWTHARKLAATVLKAAGWILVPDLLSMLFKGLTLGVGTVVTAVPQGAAAGFGSYVIGQAAKYYFEHGSSWGPEGPKLIVKQILDATDRDSVLNRLKDEIRKRIVGNQYS